MLISKTRALRTFGRIRGKNVKSLVDWHENTEHGVNELTKVSLIFCRVTQQYFVRLEMKNQFTNKLLNIYVS